MRRFKDFLCGYGTVGEQFQEEVCRIQRREYPPLIATLSASDFRDDLATRFRFEHSRSGYGYGGFGGK